MVPERNDHLFSEKRIFLITMQLFGIKKNQMGDVGPLPALKKIHITFGTLIQELLGSMIVLSKYGRIS